MKVLNISGLLPLALSVLITACTAVQEPVQAPFQERPKIKVLNSFPDIMPKGATRFEETQLVFVHADHTSTAAASLLVPIPFVTDAIVGSAKSKTVTEYEKHYQDLSILSITEDVLQATPGLEAGEGAFNLYPIVFIEECVDEVYRISLAYQVEQAQWMNRYYYHLHYTLPLADVGNPTLEALKSLSEELRTGSEVLINLIKRDINGELNNTGEEVKVGSLYIVGSKVGGLTSPKLMVYAHSKMVEEDESTVVLRIPGDPKTAAKSGGMAFGLHYFRKDQLHTFKRKEGS